MYRLARPHSTPQYRHCQHHWDLLCYTLLLQPGSNPGWVVFLQDLLWTLTLIKVLFSATWFWVFTATTPTQMHIRSFVAGTKVSISELAVDANHYCERNICTRPLGMQFTRCQSYTNKYNFFSLSLEVSYYIQYITFKASNSAYLQYSHLCRIILDMQSVFEAGTRRKYILHFTFGMSEFDTNCTWLLFFTFVL